MKKKHFCLNMIVKNETERLPRLLKSVKDVIDYYVISDTGSTDGTPEFIKKTMDEYKIPGEIHHDKWVNFGHNRQKALEHAVEAEVDYIFIIDADEKFEYQDKNFPRKLTHDWYDVKRIIGANKNTVYYLPAILRVSNKNEIGWCWKAPVHNYISCGDAWKHRVKRKRLDGVMIHAQVGGAKSAGVTSKEKYLRDAKILEEELKKNPKDTRSQFYLAQSYRDAGEHKKAVEHYIKRAQMGGWKEEQYYSLYQVGKILRSIGGNYEDFVAYYLKAYECFPYRAEALYELVSFCRKRKMYFQGYLFGRTAVEMLERGKKGVLFLNKAVHDYLLYDEYSVCAYWSGNYKESMRYCQKLLVEKKFPKRELARIKKNLDFSVRKIKLLGQMVESKSS